MDHLTEMHETPVPDQVLRGRIQYLVSVLMICFWSGLTHGRFPLSGLLIIALIGLLTTYTLSSSAVSPSRRDVTVTVEDGKYIPKEFSTRTGALRVPEQPSAPRGRSSNPSKVPERASSPKDQLAVVLYRHNAVSKALRHRNAAMSEPLPNVEIASSSLSTVPLLVGKSFPRFSPVPPAQSIGTRDALYISTPCIYQTVTAAELSTVEEPTGDRTPVATDIENASQVEPKAVDIAGDRRIVVGTESEKDIRSEPATMEAREGNVSHKVKNDTTSHTGPKYTVHPLAYNISEKGKRLESRVIRPVTDNYDCEDEADEEAPGIAPRFESGEVPEGTVRPHVVNELGDWLGRLSIAARNQSTASEEDVGSVGKKDTVNELGDWLDRLSIAAGNQHTVSQEDVGGVGREAPVRQRDTSGTVPANKSRIAIVPIARNRTTARKSKAQRLVRFRDSKLRFQLPERGLADRARTARLNIIKARASLHQSSANQQAATDSYVDANGRMLVVEVNEQAQGQVGGGDSVGVQTSQQAQEQVDEVMIGSDVEAEMEVDDETPDGESMDLAQDGVQVESNEAVPSDPMDIDQESTPDPMDIDDQSSRGTVNREEPQARTGRGKAETALRQTSTATANGGGMASGSVGVVPQRSQQHAAPVSVSETGNGAASIGQGLTRHLTSTNSAADLRDARRGKRAESRAAPEGVTVPSPLPGLPTTEDGKKPELNQSSPPPSTTSSGEQKRDNGHKSESTQSTTTPTSTAPTSVPSTPPRSPLARNMAPPNGSPKPSSAKAEALAPKEQNRKRGHGPLVDPGESEKPGSEQEIAKANQGNESTPGSASQKVSPTRRILPVKRAPKAPTSMRKADAGQKTQDPTPGPASQPAGGHPAESSSSSPTSSSKKARRKPTEAAASEETVAPLSDIPDNRGEQEYTANILLLAGDAWETCPFAGESDDEEEQEEQGDHGDDYDVIS